MKDLEIDLQERLGLKNKPELRIFEKPSKNYTFLVIIEGSPAYFLKIYNIHEANKIAAKEREEKAVKFFYSNRILSTPEPIIFGNNYFLARYEKNLTNVKIGEAIEDIAAFHSRALDIEDYSKFENDLIFHNDRRERGLIRLEKHGDLVYNLWHNISDIKKEMKKLDCEVYFGVPKILVHGDLHRGNIQQREDGKRLFIDFERTYYDYLTWDMARALMDLSPEIMEQTISQYIDLMEGTKLMNGNNKDKIRKLILGDCLFRLITDIIADQQNPHFSEVAKAHLKRYRVFIKELLLKLRETK